MEASQSIIDKIRKLKQLSEGAARINSIAESENASLAVHRLLTKYNLSLVDIESRSDEKPSIEIEKSELISVQNMYGRAWKERLLMTLCRYNYCRMIASSYKVFILGTELNTTAVIDLFNSLQSIYLYNAKKDYEKVRKHMRGGQLTESYKRKHITSFLLGCPIGLSVKLDRIQTKECTSLIVKHDELIDKYVYANLKLRSKPLKEIKVKSSAYNRGYDCGINTGLKKTLN
ncbi:DUF2786 domain-containing protein [Proteiniphilum sp.]|uniref:DUF2786 domain-containing protein n=1 Tax=Proteiniphilum sp. TaxID=1926877 RepID=UPI002B2008A8|nr:DUF2786 domain-containing protein [Proteiniphilum sp.]MEA4916310.1 DUF2786 domain-containing protein [Proteiniphilum sp.]